MDRKSSFEKELEQFKNCGPQNEKYLHLAFDWAHSFEDALEASGRCKETIRPIIALFFTLVIDQIKHPHIFEKYHRKVRHPFDYYKFSLDMFKPFIDLKESKILGREIIEQINGQLAKGENVIFLSNHQTESDPQALSVLLEADYPSLAEKIIFVAGDRVTTDPLAIPFSLGTDLLCIYSKRYELTEDKLQHNRSTMELMSRMLKEGGKAIYVACAGGRDRKDAQGKLTPSPFDSSSIEMFYLMAKKAKTPTHFYPLALDTYKLLPPPETVQVELGEKRIVNFTSIGAAFGPECNLEHTTGETKEERRKNKADKIWKTVCHLYQELT